MGIESVLEVQTFTVYSDESETDVLGTYDCYTAEEAQEQWWSEQDMGACAPFDVWVVGEYIDGEWI